jgi:Leucine-rich repeat (LRR) protein
MEILQRDEYRVVHLTDGNLITTAIELINSGQADGINFNYTRNFPATIDAIRLAKSLKFIQINDYSWDYDYSVINEISTLESLSIYTTDKKEVDFSKFPFLKSVAIYWRPKAISLFDCFKLENIFLGKYSEPDLNKLKNLRQLKYLRINTGSMTTLNGIEQLQNLEILWIMQATKLTKLSGIETLPNLTELRIDNCKNIKDIDMLSKLTDKVDLTIAGTTPKTEWKT